MDIVLGTIGVTRQLPRQSGVLIAIVSLLSEGRGNETMCPCQRAIKLPRTGNVPERSPLRDVQSFVSRVEDARLS